MSSHIKDRKTDACFFLSFLFFFFFFFFRNFSNLSTARGHLSSYITGRQTDAGFFFYYKIIQNNFPTLLIKISSSMGTFYFVKNDPGSLFYDDHYWSLYWSFQIGKIGVRWRAKHKQDAGSDLHRLTTHLPSAGSNFYFKSTNSFYICIYF